MGLLEHIIGPEDLRKLPVSRLPLVAAEIREAITAQVSRSGGHLAPNLGVVDLTIALHYVFDFKHDRLLFDVGHQCYPHKLLTGRRDLLRDLRTSRGMAGFPEPSESEYDLFRVGHAGTAISTAVGMARGDELAGDAFDRKSNPSGRRVVSLIGDASIVNGVAMEGLNNAGTLNRQFLVVLNDNGMSIAGPQGAMADYFDRMRLSRSYTGLKRRAKKMLTALPGGGLVGETYHRVGEATKAWLPDAGERSWFEHFGLVAVGPIDGHNIAQMVDFLREAASFDRPMVLHVKTVKGKGFEFSEGDARAFHSPAAFQVNGCQVEMKTRGRSFTTAFSDAMTDLLERDESVVACTAAMPDGTGLTDAMSRFPNRVWDTGICESHAMDMMAGIARTGRKPFFAVYSTFLQRAFDQAFQEVALQGLPVRLCLDRAGLVGGDGAVHHGFCDVAMLRALPGAVLTAAIDEPSLRAALEFMRTYDDGMSVVRYPRDSVTERFLSDDCPAFVLGKSRLLMTNGEGFNPATEAPDVAILVFGALAERAADAAERLAPQSRVAVYDARFAKPIDRDLVDSLLRRNIPIVTVEDHALHGGFGSAILEVANELGLDASCVTRLGMPDEWIMQDPRESQLEIAGIDAGAIASAARAAIENSNRPQVEVRTDARRATAH